MMFQFSTTYYNFNYSISTCLHTLLCAICCRGFSKMFFPNRRKSPNHTCKIFPACFSLKSSDFHHAKLIWFKIDCAAMRIILLSIKSWIRMVVYIWNECSTQKICSSFNNTLQTWNLFSRPSAVQVNVYLWKNRSFLILNEKNLLALFLTV